MSKRTFAPIGQRTTVALVVFTVLLGGALLDVVNHRAQLESDLAARASAGAAAMAGTALDEPRARRLLSIFDGHPMVRAAEVRDDAGILLARTGSGSASGAGGSVITVPLRGTGGRSGILEVMPGEFPLARHVAGHSATHLGLGLLGCMLLGLTLGRRSAPAIPHAAPPATSPLPRGAPCGPAPGGPGTRAACGFHELVQTSRSLMLIVDRHDVVRFANHAAMDVLGRDASTLPGSPLNDLIHPDDRLAFELARTASSGPTPRTSPTDIRMRSARGDWRVLEVLVHVDPGTVMPDGLLLEARNVTERRAQEDRLRDQSRHYRMLVEHAADAFFLHDEEGRLLDVNQRACENLGYTYEELRTMQVRDIEMNAPAPGVQGLWSTLSVGVPRTLDGTHRRKDGTTFPVELRVEMFETHGRRLMVAIARDVSERERAAAEVESYRRRAEELAQAKSRLVANVSHEIRNPLNAIFAVTEVMLRQTPQERDRRNLEIIDSSCAALLSAVEDILDLSKAEAGAVQLACEPFDITETVERVLDLHARAACKKGLALSALVEPSLPRTLRGDCGRIGQIVGNLVANAVNYTSRGEVSVHVRDAGRDGDRIRVRVQVRDTGPGIKPDERERLFEPFVRFSRADGAPGSGLGLSIARHLVQRMDGELTVESEEGNGAQFTFVIPLEPAAQQAATVEVPPEFQGRSVLVLEASPGVSRCLAEYVRATGMEPLLANGADHAITMLRARAEQDAPVALALIDAAFPRMGGLMVARALHEDARLCATRGALLLPLTQPSGLEETIANLPGPHLLKPVRQSTFATAVAGLLARAPQPVDGAPTPEDDSTVTSVHSRSVLLVEDNPANRHAVAALLEIEGCQVVTASDGHAALREITQRAFDVVLMDCELPGIDGWEVCRRVRAAERGATRTRIIALTAHTGAEERERCVDAGMDAVLVKPLDRDALQAVLRERTGASTVTYGRPVQPHQRAALRALFVEDAHERLEVVRAALDKGATDVVRREAHALVGGCVQVRAGRLASKCRNLGEMARIGDHARLGAAVRAVEQSLARFESSGAGGRRPAPGQVARTRVGPAPTSKTMDTPR